MATLTSPPPIPDVLDNPLVLKIAKTHLKTPAQVLLRHLIQQQIVVIPKSVTPKRILENFQVSISPPILILVQFGLTQSSLLQVFDFALSDEEMEAMNALDKGSEHRSFLFDFFLG